MLYVLLGMAVLTIAYALLNPKQIWVWHSVAMLASLLSSMFFFVFYSACTVFRYSIYQQYMGLSRANWRWMIFAPITDHALVFCLNLSVLLFIFSSLLFALRFSGFYRRTVFRYVQYVVAAVLAIELFIFDPIVGKWMYFAVYPRFTSPSGFVHAWQLASGVCSTVNMAFLLISGSVMLVNLFQTLYLRILRIPVVSVTVLFCVTIAFFVLLLGDIPAPVTKYSKVANLVYYIALPISRADWQARWVPFVLFAIDSIYLIALFSYSWYEIRMSGASHDFHRRFDVASVTARMFCHYMKNEVLALRAEIETGHQAETPEETREALDRMDDRLDAIFERLNHVHDQLKKVEMILRPLSLDALLHRLVRLTGREIRPARLQVENPAPNTWVLADEHYLCDAISQLIYNAADAIRHLPETDQLIRIQCQPTPRWLRLSVTDSGSGIDTKEQHNLFRPFYSTKPTARHWGMGLAICYSIIAAHDGRISVESKIGKGSTFLVLLPAIPADIQSNLNRR